MTRKRPAAPASIRDEIRALSDRVAEAEGVARFLQQATETDKKRIAELEVERDTLAARVAALRPVVWRFAELMETRLRENDDKGGWSDMAKGALFQRLFEESHELFEHVKYRGAWRDEIGRQAADVANFALFIADVCGALAAPATLGRVESDPPKET